MQKMETDIMSQTGPIHKVMVGADGEAGQQSAMARKSNQIHKLSAN